MAEFGRAWTVILAAAVGVGLGITGLPIYTTGLFVGPLHDAFGWSRAQATGGLIFITLGSVLMAPVIGTLIERYGVRAVAALAQVGFGLGYAGLTLHGGSLSLFYLGWCVLAVLGAGTSPIVWTRAVASWFDRSRGLALGITLCGTGMVAVFGPGLIGAVIAANGWKAGFLALAAAQVIVGLPLTLLLLRARGERVGGVVEGGEVAAELSGVSLREAASTSQFWRLLLAFFLISVVVGGLIVHLAPMLADLRVSPADAGRALGLLGVAIIAGRLSIGALVDRLPPTLVAPVFICLPVPSCLLLAQGQSPELAIVLAGLAAGAEVDLLAFLMSRYFGMLHYARIYAWGLSAFSLGAGVGPILAGAVHDRTGSYVGALYGFAVLMVLGAGLIASLGRPAGERREVALA